MVYAYLIFGDVEASFFFYLYNEPIDIIPKELDFSIYYSYYAFTESLLYPKQKMNYNEKNE